MHVRFLHMKVKNVNMQLLNIFMSFFEARTPQKQTEIQVCSEKWFFILTHWRWFSNMKSFAIWLMASTLTNTKGGQRPWSGCVWLSSGSACSGWQSCSLAKQGRDSSLPLLPVSCHVYLNIGPQQKNCPPLCVCTAPIASAITGIKVKESRYGSNLW